MRRNEKEGEGRRRKEEEVEEVEEVEEEVKERRRGGEVLWFALLPAVMLNPGGSAGSHCVCVCICNESGSSGGGDGITSGSRWQRQQW